MEKNVFKLSVVAFICTIIAALSISSCKGNSAPQSEPTPLNLSVFLDLSDRLDSTCNGNFPVSQMTRDTAIVNALLDLFIDTCIVHKISESKDHFQILFHPTPNTSDIAAIAANLNVDLAKITEPGGKKKRLMSMKDDFAKGLSLIYNQTLKARQWLGSDIWGFFCNKNAKVDDLCIRKNYRNVLVILTDGYIYHESNTLKDGNSYSYVLPKMIDQIPELSLMAPRKGLDNLEVLMLEINPGKPIRQAKLISTLEDWLKNMEIKHYTVSETGMPSDTHTIIDNFFK